MKKNLLMSTVAMLLYTVNADASNFDSYISIKATNTDFDVDFDYYDTWYFDTVHENYSLSDKGWGGSVAAGLSFQYPKGKIRTELEYNKKADLEDSFTEWGDKATMKIQSLMLNTYYDIDTGTKFTPYIGGGIGYAQIKIHDAYWNECYGEDIKGTNFSWQLGAGVSYLATDNISFDIGYRYINFGDVSETQNYDINSFEKNEYNITAKEFYLGLRYQF